MDAVDDMKTWEGTERLTQDGEPFFAPFNRSFNPLPQAVSAQSED